MILSLALLTCLINNIPFLGIREFHCKLCNYKGVTQSDLNRHNKSQIHILKSRNQCHQCQEGFVSPFSLQEHVVQCRGKRESVPDRDASAYPLMKDMSEAHDVNGTA